MCFLSTATGKETTTFNTELRSTLEKDSSHVSLSAFAIFLQSHSCQGPVHYPTQPRYDRRSHSLVNVPVGFELGRGMRPVLPLYGEDGAQQPLVVYRQLAFHCLHDDVSLSVRSGELAVSHQRACGTQRIIGTDGTRGLLAQYAEYFVELWSEGCVKASNVGFCNAVARNLAAVDPAN